MCKILVVDDDHTHLCILDSILTKAGYQVVCANDGSEALNKYDKTFDLVITDIFMPIMDGIELIKKIKQKNNRQPIIAITACGYTDDEGYAQNALDAGACNVFDKPYSWQELLNIAKDLISKNKAKTTNHNDVLSILIVDDNKSIHESFKAVLYDISNLDIKNKLNNLFDTIFTDNNTDEDSANNLVNLNISLDFALQGHEGVEKFKSKLSLGQCYDFVFMDVRMPPGINGIEAAKKIKEIKHNAKIIITSAYSDYTWEDIVDKIGHTEGLSYLSKPFTRDAVVNIICRDL